MPPILPSAFSHVFEGCTEIKEIDFSSLYPSAFVYTKHIQQRDPLDQAYEIVFNTIITQSSEEKIEEYKTLLKMYNNDYRSVVLAIETK